MNRIKHTHTSSKHDMAIIRRNGLNQQNKSFPGFWLKTYHDQISLQHATQLHKHWTCDLKICLNKQTFVHLLVIIQMFEDSFTRTYPVSLLCFNIEYYRTNWNK